VIGALLSTLGMTGVVFGLVRAAEVGWTDPVTIGALGGGVLLQVLFVINEWWAEQPILPLRLFRSRERAGGYAGRLLFLGGMLSFRFFTTQYLQRVLGFSPLETGFAFLPTTVLSFSVALSTRWLAQRLGAAWVLAAPCSSR